MVSQQPLSDEIRASGSYRFADQLRGLVMYAWPSATRVILTFLAGMTFLIAGVVLLGREERIEGIVFVLVGLFFLVGLWLAVLLVAYRQWTGIPHRGTRVQIVLDDGGLAVESPFGAGKTLWSAFPKWQEGRHLFLVYMTRSLFFIIPKRFLDASDVDRVRGLLAEKIAKRR